MAKPEIPLINGDEHDAFTSWRRFYIWRPGELTKIKKRYHKRVRQFIKRLIRKEDKEGRYYENI
ncbi:hypothetical protein M0R04_05655 [Candidatus Dojkabacteria bacterium]|jgi:hypothetical protein|nr:hypothetical protein [Candidatus Dojkabacteria bacterium]